MLSGFLHDFSVLEELKCESMTKSLAAVSLGFAFKFLLPQWVSVTFLPSYITAVLKLPGAPREEHSACRCHLLPTVLSQEYYTENKLSLSFVYWVLKF